MAAAIEVVAELGWAKASFGRIADRAGLSSTGMISYHFAGKDDLFAACVAETERRSGEFMDPRVGAVSGYVAQVRAYVEANVALVGEHPVAVRALIDLVAGAGVRSAEVQGRTALFEEHFRAGQAAGEFGAFDVHVVAVALIAALDATVGALARDPAVLADPVELARRGTELADMCIRATAREPERNHA